MSIWKKIQSFTDKITGKSALVQLQIDGNSMKAPFVVRVTVSVSDSPITIRKVAVRLKSEETIIARNVNLHNPMVSHGKRRDVKQQEILFQSESNLSIESLSLEANQNYEFEGEFVLSKEAMPTYKGRNATHQWYVQAYIDTLGSNPSSEWVQFTVV